MKLEYATQKVTIIFASGQEHHNTIVGIIKKKRGAASEKTAYI